MSIVKEILKQEGWTSADNKPVENVGGSSDDNNNDSNQPPAPPAKEPTIDDIPDDKLLAAIAKRTGRSLTSFDELNPPTPPAELTVEQKTELERKRRENIRKFGLENNKLTTTELEEYERANATDRRAIALIAYKEERLQELRAANTPDNEMPDDNDLKGEFDDLFFQYAEESDYKRKKREKDMDDLAEKYLRNKHSKVFSLESEYENHTQTQALRGEYQQTVESSFAALPQEFEIPIVSGKTTYTYKYKPSEEALQTARAIYENDQSFTVFGQNKVNKENLTAAITNTIREKEFLNIVKEVAEAHANAILLEAKKGRRGIPEGAGGGGLQVGNNDDSNQKGGIIKGIIDKHKHSQLT